MKFLSVAKRYSNALIQVAQQKGELESFYEQLQKVEECFKNSADLKMALGSPVLTPSKKKSILTAILNQLGVAQEILYFFQVLIDHERIPYVSHILLIYRDMADDLLGRVRVDLKTAQPLGEKQDKLRQVLEKKLNKKVLIDEKADPSLIGGMILKIKDQVFDASLRRELEKLKESIAFQPVI